MRVCLLVMIAACGYWSPPGPASHAPVLVILTRDGCLDRCPVYTLTIYQDGVVEYRGEANVAVTGQRVKTLDASTLREMKADFARAGWSTMRAAEGTTCYDLPLGSLGYDGKRIEFSEGDPLTADGLVALSYGIGDLAGVDAWVGPNVKIGICP